MNTLKTTLGVVLRIVLLPVSLSLDIAKLLGHDIREETHFGKQMDEIEEGLAKLK